MVYIVHDGVSLCFYNSKITYGTRLSLADQLWQQPFSPKSTSYFRTKEGLQGSRKGGNLEVYFAYASMWTSKNIKHGQWWCKRYNNNLD